MNRRMRRGLRARSSGTRSANIGWSDKPPWPRAIWSMFIGPRRLVKSTATFAVGVCAMATPESQMVAEMKAMATLAEIGIVMPGVLLMNGGGSSHRWNCNMEGVYLTDHVSKCLEMR